MKILLCRSIFSPVLPEVELREIFLAHFIDKIFDGAFTIIAHLELINFVCTQPLHSNLWSFVHGTHLKQNPIGIFESMSYHEEFSLLVMSFSPATSAIKGIAYFHSSSRWVEIVISTWTQNLSWNSIWNKICSFRFNCSLKIGCKSWALISIRIRMLLPY